VFFLLSHFSPLIWWGSLDFTNILCLDGGGFTFNVQSLDPGGYGSLLPSMSWEF
jgi:hypothetical protein